MWLIWSNEHKAWWGPRKNGYTRTRDDAGYYTFEEALQIVREANMHRSPDQEPYEAMVFDGNAEQARDLTAELYDRLNKALQIIDLYDGEIREAGLDRQGFCQGVLFKDGIKKLREPLT